MRTTTRAISMNKYFIFTGMLESPAKNIIGTIVTVKIIGIDKNMKMEKRVFLEAASSVFLIFEGKKRNTKKRLTTRDDQTNKWIQYPFIFQ